MDQQVRAQVKRIKIQTKRLMQSSLVGDYSSAFKGVGLEFDQLREYQVGDDVRFIDWNASVKSDRMMIKQFVEERDRTVIIAVDVSASGLYGSGNQLRRDMLVELASTLAWIAVANKDKVGLLLFSDRIELWRPPKRGIAHFTELVATLCNHQPLGRGTDITGALKFLIGLKKRQAIAFMISDWIDNEATYGKLLRIANCEYDFVAIRCIDQREREFLPLGLVELEDPETSENVLAQAGNGPQSLLSRLLLQRLGLQKRLFASNKIDLLDLVVGDSFIMPLVTFFHQRTARHV